MLSLSYAFPDLVKVIYSPVGAATMPQTFCLSQYLMYKSASLLGCELLCGKEHVLLAIFVLLGPISAVYQNREKTLNIC